MGLDIFNLKENQCIQVTKESIRNGMDGDQELVQNLLHIGETYHIADWEIHNWHTEIYLTEFPDIRFNSVNFEECEVNNEKLERELS